MGCLEATSNDFDLMGPVVRPSKRSLMDIILRLATSKTETMVRRLRAENKGPVSEPVRSEQICAFKLFTRASLLRRISCPPPSGLLSREMHYRVPFVKQIGLKFFDSLLELHCSLLTGLIRSRPPVLCGFPPAQPVGDLTNQADFTNITARTGHVQWPLVWMEKA